MHRYYFMVHFLPTKANAELLAGRCIHIMHGFVARHNVDGLGVSFPTWSAQTVGSAIAFIHSAATVLEQLKQQSYFKEMSENDLFYISDVEAVPDDCTEVRFKRNQNIAKLFSGEMRRRLKRAEKRALARGEVYHPPKADAVREVDHFHEIVASSGSNGQNFILHVQKEQVQDRSEPIFNGYGLATNERFRGTVPDLSSVYVKPPF